jgi:tetratricopeptide (TPR) repeat protein
MKVTESSLNPLQAIAARLKAVVEALALTSASRPVSDQLDHAARRLQAHSQKPLASERQLTLINHDLAAAAFWLDYLVQAGIFPARRLDPLRQEMAHLLDHLLNQSLHAAPAPRPAPASPPPPEPPHPAAVAIVKTAAAAAGSPPAEPRPRQTPSRTQVSLSGRAYTWDGQAWQDEFFLKPPEVVIRQLNELLRPTLADEDQTIGNVYQLVERARIARDNLQYDRAELLARRILALEPRNQMGAAVLCAALRARRKPAAALAETEAFSQTGNAALLTSRAAAYCDLGLWAEAKKEIGHSLAIQASEEAFLVVKRIKAERPGLYRQV